MASTTRNNTWQRWMLGRFSDGEAPRFVLWKAGVFWGLILLCWIVYPAENAFSIQTHTFSFLGSFEDRHNPAGWWLFTAAMCFWGAAMVPAALYCYRHFRPIAPRAAGLGAALLILGGVGIALVGLFPDARGEVFAGMRWTDIHEKAAVLAAVSFGLAVPLHGALLIVARWRMGSAGNGGWVRPGPLFWPFFFWAVATTVGVSVQVRWAVLYEAMKAEATATGTNIGSSWAEGLRTWYSFPLWENLLIYTLYIFLCWFLLALHRHPPVQPAGGDGNRLGLRHPEAP